jgi:hypothetical protein
MKTGTRLWTNLILLCFVFVMYSRCPAWAQSFQPLKLEPSRVLWSDLSYRAGKVVVDVKVDIRLAPFSTPEFESIWQTYPQRIPLPTVCQRVYSLEVNRVVDYIFSRAVRLWNQVLFDPQKADSFYRVRLRRGKDDIERTYWFSGEGVHRLRRMPKVKAETSLDPAKWTDVRTSFYPYDLTRLGCPQVVDPMLLIYLVSAAPVDEEGKVLSLCVFGKQQLHRVTLGYQRLETLEVDYSLKSGEGTVRKKGKVDGRMVTVKSVPLVSNKKNAENFSFLGMHEDITIHLDPQLRIPLQVSGRIPTVGLVTLRLSEATLKEPL